MRGEKKRCSKTRLFTAHSWRRGHELWKCWNRDLILGILVPHQQCTQSKSNKISHHCCIALLPFYCALLSGPQPTEQCLCCELPGSKELRRLSTKTKKLSWNGKPVGFAWSLIILRKDKSGRKILESEANAPHKLHHAAACDDKRCPPSPSEACFACHTVREQP